jgi:aconitase B|tara:strand:+ start:5121 stop:5606 length:486 start_codon:yes stop_codon:yes gene_type:complete
MSKSNNFTDNFDDLQQKYITNKSENIPVSPKSNLNVQMNMYDDEKINSQILELEDILKCQKDRLKYLKDEDPEKCLKNCKLFLKENDKNISDQLDTILELNNNIKNTVEECETIESQEEKLNEMLNEPQFVDLADKIKKIRGTIDNLNYFLVRKKISNHKN